MTDPTALGAALLAFAADPAHHPLSVALVVDEADDASASIMWGRESEDSDMVGAHALATGSTINEALEKALTEAGVDLPS